MEYKKRVLALDIGEKRIGLAVSDPFGITAQALESYTRRSDAQDIEHIMNVAKQYEPVTLLFGLPRNMNGTYGPQAEKIQAYAAWLTGELKDRLDFDTAFYDERLSSVAAERVLLSADVSRKKRRQVIDKLAASVILQGYLERM